MVSSEEKERKWIKFFKAGLEKLLSPLLSSNNERPNGDKQSSEGATPSADFREFPLPHQEPPLETIVKIDAPACRICQETKNGKGKRKLVAPCGCKGSTKYVHKKCLQKWCATKKTTDCEICNFPYQSRYLEAPELSKSDQNALVFSSMVFCLLTAIFTVSVYLLISHLYVVHFTFSGDCWLLLFLSLGSGCGLAAFLFWFTKNTRRIMKNRRDQLRDIRGLTFESPVQISVIPTTTSQDSQ